MSSPLLFLLFLFNTLAIGPKQLLNLSKPQWLQSAITMCLLFIILPVLQAAAAILLLKDRDFVLGVVVASCAPSALVIPFFANLRGADGALSLLNVVISSLLCPVAIVLMLLLTGFSSVFIDVRFLALYLFTLTAVPLALSFIVVGLRRDLPRYIGPVLPLLNSVLLAALIFILVGGSLHQVPLRMLLKGDLLPLVLLFTALEFGLFFVVRQSAALFLNAFESETMALSLATRNYAVSASLLLFFYPKAALPSAIGLMIHAVFFQWLARKRHDRMPI